MASDRRGSRVVASSRADDDEDAMERELAEDAVWKRIQQNTFTRWANEHLKTVNKTIASLETDLADGLRLISLIEVLSGKQLPKHNKRPTFRSQKLENVCVALKFLTNQEGIKLVNIDSSDIVDCKLKLILGLIWTLILHYSISLPMWEGDDDTAFDKSGPSPKQRLLRWIQSKLPDKPINNFTSDWNDGQAVGALVDALAPGLCPDWASWDPKNAQRNAKEAMDLASEWLGVPQLVTPEEMVNPKVDELSMMTYLSQFPNAKLKDKAPLRLQTNPARVRCYGPGIEPTGVVVGAPTTFTVETFSAGKGDVKAHVEAPGGQQIPVDIRYNDDKAKTYTATYTALKEGPHKVHVQFAGKAVPKSPFPVKVEGFAGDPTKVKATGPGLQPTGVSAGVPTYFDVFSKAAGKGQVEVEIVDPKGGRNTIPCRVKKTNEDEHHCEYVPSMEGPHQVNVLFAGRPVPGSPFKVNVGPPCNPRRVRASGRGLQKNGVRVGDVADFKVFTENAGEGELQVKVLGPGGSVEKVNITPKPDKTYECNYHPSKEGRYVVMISYGGQEIPRSPYEVNVGPYKESKIVAYGPGLSGGLVGYPATFTVDTNGETGQLGFAIEGPSKAKIECYDNGDGSADVKYFPTAPGEYAVHVLCNGEDIPKSPWIATILPQSTVQPDKVVASGPGLQPTGVLQGQPTQFTVDARQAGGKAPLEVIVADSQSRPVEVKVKDNGDDTYTCTYKPESNDKHTVQVNYSCVAVPGSPFRVNVADNTDPGKVRVYGPGVEKGVTSQTPTKFYIDCKAAGKAKPKVKITDEKERQVQSKVTDNKDDTYTCNYTAPTPGPHYVNVSVNGKDVLGSPFKVNVASHLDASKIKVEGLEPTVFLEAPAQVMIDARAISPNSDARVTCTLSTPSGKKIPIAVQPKGDGTYRSVYIPHEEGPHEVELTYDGVPIPGSPFKTMAVKGCDPSRVKAYGPGLEKGILDQPNRFTVETRGAGPGGLGLAIEGPTEAKMTCKDNRDGTCTVEYIPSELGDYDIAVRFAGKDIPGSPFKVPVDAPVDPSKVVAYGPGLEPRNCRANVPQKFTVDARKVGKAPMAVEVSSEKGPVPQKPTVKDNKDGTYDVNYMPPPEKSDCNVRITYDNKDIPNSPYKMKVRPTCEPQNVKLVGLDNKPVPASIPQEFTIDAREAGVAQPEVTVKGPDNVPRKARVVDNDDGTFRSQYVLTDVGKHQLSVKYGGKEVPGSPATLESVPTGQADKCKISEETKQEKVTIGEEYCLTVNAKQAGKGAVTCTLTNAAGAEPDVDVEVEDNGDGTFTIFYRVKEAGEHQVNIKFGGQPVPGGTYKITAVTERIQQKTVVNRRFRSAPPPQGKYRPIQLFDIPLQQSAGGQLSAEVKMPSGRMDKPVIIDNQNGTVSIQYEPREEGLHELHIKYNHEHVQGSPFKFHVDTIQSGYVTAYGPGLTHGVAGEPSNFTISTKDAGKGGLNVAVEGPSKAEISVHDNKDGTVAVSYLPAAPGEYKISIKFADKPIKGSPFTAKITGEGRKRNQISVGHSSEVSLKVQEKDVKNLSASIVAPSGLEEPCFLKKLPNGHLGISFTPREVGEHLINVKRTGSHITGSPFKINVLEREIGDAAKVKVQGKALTEGTTQVRNEFTIDTREAGYGGLSLSVEGPSKADIQCKDNEDGTLKVSYLPTEPGYYIINLKFADHHVTGSPFTVKVTGKGSNIQRENIKKQREAAPIAEVGSKCTFTYKMPGTSAFDMTARVTSPSGTSEDAEIADLEDCSYAVHFVPKEAGVHTVSVRNKDIHIPGSPFQFTVGPFRDHGAHRVHAGGPGLERGIAGESCEFNVWTREAGAGSLSISVEGPSKAKIDFKDRKDGSCYVSYVVKDAGEYRVGIKFNDQHIPDSPFKVYVMPQAGDTCKIELGSVPEHMQVNKPVAFTISMNGAKGNLDGKVVTPSGHEDDCFVAPLDDDQWCLRFIPRENGIHQVHIRHNGIHIPASPFRIRVGKDDADPAAVQAYGPGLRDVKSGVKTDFIVDTCNAGAGSLAVTIDGPTKVNMDCTEEEEGYKVRYTPLAPGEYFITVKFNGYHIAGSPFRVSCTGSVTRSTGGRLSIAPPTSPETSSMTVDTVVKQAVQKADQLPKFRSNASKVTCKGMGLKRAVLNKQNQFTVNALDAGNNLIYASVYGPKGPCDEVFVKHLGRNLYQVNYVVKDRGDHIVIVKWGDDHIPGSPFKVEVV